ncbi:hypothetical protein [Singulisphaera acidiphila]|uniref:Uncharacterized protein n=1 Tax=Singulisphaera acidiphila (strain ATCC BAA-1392 / DSM 18658 / VKM B-2454 / MOB10) TaxID=886293 RepID=L0DB93_SINAD|nr:hypothetical protein [Singulisphaera acidiphila]AGA26512.1 hypothetical protein Sinac_2189 [Singulisphaera acidiphila DSM 18658]
MKIPSDSKLSLFRPFVAVLCAAQLVAAQSPPEIQHSQKARRFFHNPFREKTPVPPAGLSLVDFGNKLDDISDDIRDDGLVVIKQPDVYSQSRMTKYRVDFDKEMAKELDAFKFILSSRIARTDQAAVESQTALVLQR